jgi:hypothetical protein
MFPAKPLVVGTNPALAARLFPGTYQSISKSGNQKNVNIHKDHVCKENLLINGSMNTKFQNNTCKIRAPFRTLS